MTTSPATELGSGAHRARVGTRSRWREPGLSSRAGTPDWLGLRTRYRRSGSGCGLTRAGDLSNSLRHAVWCCLESGRQPRRVVPVDRFACGNRDRPRQRRRGGEAQHGRPWPEAESDDLAPPEELVGRLWQHDLRDAGACRCRERPGTPVVDHSAHLGEQKVVRLLVDKQTCVPLANAGDSCPAAVDHEPVPGTLRRLHEEPAHALAVTVWHAPEAGVDGRRPRGEEPAELIAQLTTPCQQRVARLPHSEPCAIRKHREGRVGGRDRGRPHELCHHVADAREAEPGASPVQRRPVGDVGVTVRNSAREADAGLDRGSYRADRPA